MHNLPSNLLPAQCARCGVTFKHLTKRHHNACAALPKPNTLKEEFLNTPNQTTNGLARKYGVTGQFVQRHLILAGMSQEQQVLQGRKRGNKNYETLSTNIQTPLKSIQYQVKVGDLKHCRCGVIINIGDSFCTFCTLEHKGINNVYQLVGESPPST